MAAPNKPRDYHHPHTPYAVQIDFMNTLYSAIEDGCVAILESPTGTGKSLSLLCGALTWLRDNQSKTIEEQLAESDGEDDEPEWVKAHAREEKKRRLLRERTELEQRLKRIREREKREKKAAEMTASVDRRKIRRVNVETMADNDDDEQWELDDYLSDGDDGSRRPNSSNDGDGLSADVKELMAKLGMTIPGSKKEEEEEEFPDQTKIYFCSRTHSQLSQFVNELRKIDLPPPLQTDIDEGLCGNVKQLSLGSRRNLCINPRVSKLSSTMAINERCLELQKSGTPDEKRCQFLPKHDDKIRPREFRDHVLATIRDIEDVADLGTKMGICPYYASRAAIKPSEIITLPYQLLLQSSAREALDISLKNNVVIIDEAHNLMDTISSIYSVTVTLLQLQRCNEQLEFYLKKFRNRLKGGNKVYVMQTHRLLRSLTLALENLSKQQIEREVPSGDILAHHGVDQINFNKLQKYLTESKLARKLEGYLLSQQEKEQSTKIQSGRGNGRVLDISTNPASPDAVPLLTHIQSFLTALTNPSSEGKIFCSVTDSKEWCFKYMLLDPAHHFRTIVNEARAVILAGGTMQPMEDYTTHLFPYLPPDKIRTLSCGHVIPSENLLASPLVKRPSGGDFDFTFSSRNDPSMIDDLGMSIANLCNFIPHGVVCFFPSYSYLNFVVERWQKKVKDGVPAVWERLGAKKSIFRESNEKSGVEETLRDYKLAIDTGKGGLLLGVVGGKMSEGINFNDNLGRGVIMVGLPFPNPNSPEWKAKKEHVESMAYETYPLRKISTAGEPGTVDQVARKADAKAASQAFYENACMRAVNQSVGRAIRHINDYAVIVLIDRRYATNRIQAKLPGWIKSSMIPVYSGGVKQQGMSEGRVVDVVSRCAKFFRGRK